MQKIKLTKGAFNNLLYNLVEMESRRDEILDEYLTGDLKEREEISAMLDDYIEFMNKIMGSFSVQQTAKNEMPFVVVGCRVTIEDVASKEQFEYCIIPPFKKEIKYCDATILSPIGKSILKKRKGECFSIQAPGGEFKYKILSIVYEEI